MINLNPFKVEMIKYFHWANKSAIGYFIIFSSLFSTPTLCGWCHASALHCVVVSYTGALLWRSVRSVRGWPPRWPQPDVGNDLFNQCQNNQNQRRKTSRVKVRKYKKLFFLLSPAGRYSSFLLYIHSSQCSLPQTKVFQLNLKRSVTLWTFPGENIFARTHSVWPHAVTWDEVFDLRSLPIFLQLYVPLCTACSDVTSVADLRSPRVPSGWPNAGPRRKLNTEESERHHAGQKASVMCSPLTSPAKRTGSTLGPQGFIYPFFFFFCSCKESTGRQVCQVPHDRHAHGPKELHVGILPIHVVGFHIPGPPLKHYGKEGYFFWQEPAGIRGFLKEAFPRERSLTRTRAAEAERTALYAKA